MGKKQKTNEVVTNGLSDVIMGGVNPLTLGTQLSQSDTLFANNRTYLVSNLRQLLSQVYVEHGLVQTIVNVPVDDALKGGIEFKSTQLNEKELAELTRYMEKKNDIEVLKQALKWTRLFGGAGVVVMTAQKHDTLLDVNKLDGMEFRAVDMWELFSSQQNIDDDTRKLEINTNKDFCFNYYAINLHNSRVMVIKGIVAPSFVRPRLRGWGFSVLESVVQSVNLFLKTKNLTFEVLDEFKLDIFKIKGFNSTLLTKDGTAKIVQRTQLANQQKNFQNALTMDAEDDHISKQLNFSGIAEVMQSNYSLVASDLRIPKNKLFGDSASGFASGEDSIEIYNSMLESEIRPKATPVYLEMAKLRCQELFGMIPDDLEIHYAPLRTLSSEQQENVKNQKADRLIKLFDKGAISIRELKESINRDNLIAVKIEVNDEIESVEIAESSSQVSKDSNAQN